MGPLTALLFATPIFGLSLTPPPAALAPAALTAAVAAPAFVASLPPLQLAGDDEGAEDQASDDASQEENREEAGEGGVSMEEYGAMMRRRAEIRRIHKPMGIATWISMTLTLILGGIQFNNLYGFGSLEDSPCVTGEGIIFGPSQCSGAPVVHLTSAMITTALYATTFTLSLMMPDPDGLDEGDSAYASKLRTHKILRWVHLIGMISQLALGIVITNSTAFGIDRANDYGTLQALAAVHMGLGFVTWGAMTWSGALFAF